MAKKLFIFILLAAFLISAAAVAATLVEKTEHKAKLITGFEPLPDGPYYPSNPTLITQSPGVEVGSTRYDYQSNGSSGNRVAVCTDHSKYFAWMNGLNYPRPRHIYFNWVDAGGNWFSEGIGDRVNNDSVGGYTQLAVIYGTRGVIAYHGPANTYTKVAVDSDPPGFGIFNLYDVPDLVSPGTNHAIWPYVAVDRNNRIHVAITESTPETVRRQKFMYTRSTNGGSSWLSPIQFIDTVMVISGVVAASPVSDKVIIAYAQMAHMNDTISATWNDVVYVLSQDGLTWDFTNGKVNITNYLTDNDSLFAYADMAVIFDYNDNFHISWLAHWSNTVNSYYYKTWMLDYSSASQQIHDIRPAYPDSSLWYSSCDPGGWCAPICKMDYGVYHANDVNGLFVTWTQFDTSDCSQNGFGNGDIFMAYSTNDGVTWSSDTNLTDSPTPECFPGECESDHWSTLADVVDDSLHIFYVNDKDAGGIPQTEGAITDNPMMYLAVRNPLFTGIENTNARPTNFTLSQNYPNPFNAKTVVSFELKESSPVLVEVFNIAGAKVTTLVNQNLSAGSHKVAWDAGNCASGVYYYKLTAGTSSETKQMVLLK